MALKDFGAGNGILTLFGKVMKDLGDTDPPISFTPIRDRGYLKQGFGGNATKSSVINPGYRFRVCLLPGSKDSAFVSGKMASGEDARATWEVLGTGEKIILDEGIYKTFEEVGRAGTVPTDDVYIFDFNIGLDKRGDA